MNPLPAAAFPLFAAGLLLLAGLVRRYRTLAGLRRRVEAHWVAVETSLTQRGERIVPVVRGANDHPQMAALAARVQEAQNEAASAPDRGERIAAEQQVSRLLHRLSEQADAAGIREGSEQAELADLLLEMQVREQQIADARERYNEAAAAWNTFRNAFPTGLLARALSPEPAPLFEGE